MATDEPASMTDSEVRDFVGRGGTGVLSLARDDVPYSTPVSYGFDPEAGAFLLRLGFTAGSEKRAFVDASAEARLVVYGRVGDEWRSVVAVGELTRVDDDAMTPEIADVLRRADVPLLDAWDEPANEIAFELHRLEASRLTGRRGVDWMSD